MKKIGIISDTHGYWHERIAHHFSDCHEIWHAGDIGSIDVAKQLESLGKPVRAVYGNIDGQPLRTQFPLNQIFVCESVKVLITHIAKTPPQYTPRVRQLIEIEKPKLLICGHSHILKVQWVAELGLLHLNPGAAGQQGFHQVLTLITLCIDGEDMRDCRIIELGKRGSS